MDPRDLHPDAPIHTGAVAMDAEAGTFDGDTETEDIGDELYCSTREAGCHVVVGVPGIGIEPPGRPG